MCCYFPHCRSAGEFKSSQNDEEKKTKKNWFDLIQFVKQCEACSVLFWNAWNGIAFDHKINFLLKCICVGVWVCNLRSWHVPYKFNGKFDFLRMFRYLFSILRNFYSFVMGKMLEFGNQFNFIFNENVSRAHNTPYKNYGSHAQPAIRFT